MNMKQTAAHNHIAFRCSAERTWPPTTWRWAHCEPAQSPRKAATSVIIFRIRLIPCRAAGQRSVGRKAQRERHRVDRAVAEYGIPCVRVRAPKVMARKTGLVRVRVSFYVVYRRLFRKSHAVPQRAAVNAAN